VKVAVTDDLSVTVYANPDTIRRKEDTVKMWLLHDYKTVQTAIDVSYLSAKVKIEFDCSEERQRILTFTEYSGNMGRGKPVYTDPVEDEWEPITPDAISQTLWKIACKKK